jgi:hypothetical protein
LSHWFETDPDENSTGNMVALNTGQATLAAFQTGSLFDFAVKLLNLPTKATQLLRSLGRIYGRTRRAAWDLLPHDHARSRVYRWGEDGLAGISDDKQYLSPSGTNLTRS